MAEAATQTTDNSAEANTTDESLEISEKAAMAALENATKAADGEKTDSTEGQEETASEIVDIDALDKVKFQGKEYTPEEFNKMMLRQSDYTRKTQKLAEERKYYDNLAADLEAVRESPQLAEKFREVYPEKFHTFLGLAENTKANDEDDAVNESESKLIKTLQSQIEELQNKLGQYDQKFRDEKVDAAQSQLDAIFETLGNKYDLADEDAIVNRASRMLEENKDNPDFSITEAAWERLFRADHEAREKRYSERHKKLLADQAEKNKLAADGGPGGMAPGRPKKRLSFDEATEMAIQDLGG